MKTLIYILLLCGLGINSFGKPQNNRAHTTSIYINTPDSSIKASITDQAEKKLYTGRFYHWYASNQLCVTNGAYSGRLLHGTYSSFHPNHYLLSQGQFRMGLKDGCWKKWLPDGSIHEIIHYKNGQLDGAYELYSPRGFLMQRIYYRKGRRAGKTTIFSQDGQDSVILYKKGVPVIKVRRSDTGTDSADSAKTNKSGKLNNRKKDSVSSDSIRDTKKTKRRLNWLPENDSAKKRSADSVHHDTIVHKKKRSQKVKRFFRNDSTPVSDLQSPNSR